MPTKAQGRSEYKTNFKWLESFRDKKFKPSPEQMAPPAGKGSVFSSINAEPPLQHKKRVEGPPASLSINFDDGKYEASDDFALLGQQHKFASNVRYGLRPAKASKLEGKQLDLGDKQLDMNNNNNNANRDLPPPPKQMKMGESQTRARRKLGLTEARPKKESMKENLTPTSPPPAPRKPKPSDLQEVKEGLRDKNLSDVLPKGKATTKDRVNEFVQTNMDKGLALSGQEATADYSLKYKAGIAQPRVGRKASEYQKQYSWKQGVAASPLLTAEQVVYNNNAQISPPKKAPFLKTTEYQSQFKEYKVPEAVSFAPQPSQEPQRHRGRSKTQMKRSKSVGAALSPDRMVAAGSVPVTSADDPRQLRESRDNSPVPKVPIPHGKLKRVVSEYRSNFKPPTRFSYVDGAWKNAAPPHLFQNKNGGGEEKTASGTGEEQAPPLSNWFAEVLELRRRANEYKRRAQGTHFSREHLVQLLAQQTDLWDVDSTCSSSRAAALDALALEPAKARAELPHFSKQQRNKAKMSVDRVSHMAVRGDSPEPSESITVATQTRKPVEKKEKNRKKTKMAWQEKTAAEKAERLEADEQLNMNQNASCQAQLTEEGVQVDEFEIEEQGRLPTPVLQQKQRTSRHHLDRTTPSVGGVLLSAPAQLSDRSDNTEQTVSECQSTPKLKFMTEKLVTSPILGKPTPDTHPLRDEDAESDHVMETQYIPSPPVPLAVSPAKERRCAKAQQRRLNANIPTTIDEGIGQTYNVKDRGNFHVEDLPLCDTQDVDEDVLSVSAMSIASSSSLASEVYERARRRRDEFWGKPAK